jgi:predicted kinase
VSFTTYELVATVVKGGKVSIADAVLVRRADLIRIHALAAALIAHPATATASDEESTSNAIPQQTGD